MITDIYASLNKQARQAREIYEHYLANGEAYPGHLKRVRETHLREVRFLVQMIGLRLKNLETQRLGKVTDDI